MDEKHKAYASSCYIEGFCLAGNARTTLFVSLLTAATNNRDSRSELS